MKKLLLFLSPLLFLSSKCKQDCGCVTPPEPQGVVNLNFKPTLDNKPFVINQVYVMNGKKMKFTRLSFIVTESCAKATNNANSCGTNAYMFDFSTLDDSTKAAQGITQAFKQQTEGSMTGFQLSLGVAKNLNASLPKDFASSNPLSDAGLYWADWKSYIFAKIEGLMDKDGNGTYESGITLHTGSDEAFRQIWFPTTFTVDTKGSTTLNFGFNVNNLLKDIDLTTVNSSHQTGDKPTMLKIMDNMKDAISLK
ncbi:MAG: hypothetical protein JNL70_14685 [Saprospiraceae bacterium]|nr:hypothetical protein [Saprospiraceae bacterium]